ncbi:MAG: RNA polymerase sigma factor [Bacteroidales bacterium]
MTREQDLLINLRSGDYDAFRILYDTYAKQLKGFIFAMVRSEVLADDIIQDTFLKIWINRQTIDSDLSFRSYLFRIAKNAVIDEFRKNINNPLFEDYMLHCENIRISENHTDQIIDFEQFKDDLKKAKSKLTPKQREIFELNKEEGFSAKEIAVQLQITEQTVYNQLSIALQIIKKELPESLYLAILIYNMC